LNIQSHAPTDDRGRGRQTLSANAGNDAQFHLLSAAAALPDSPGRALDALLAAWQVRRAPGIADLIDRLDRLTAVGRDPLFGRSRVEAHEQWLEVEAAGDSRDLGRLMAALINGPTSDSVERVLRLRKRPADPRLAAGMIALVVEQPCSAGFRPFWKPVFEILEDSADPRLIPALAERLVAHRVRGRVFDEYLRAHLKLLLAKYQHRFGQHSQPLNLAMQALITELSHGLSSLEESHHRRERIEQDFLKAIWAAPDEDAPRLVFADWLQEQADPRGEFITLQLARHLGTLGTSGRARERELLRRHSRQWLGPIAPAILNGGLRFERGFVVGCALSASESPGIDALSVHAAWSTVKEFSAGKVAKENRARLIAHLLALGANRPTAPVQGFVGSWSNDL